MSGRKTSQQLRRQRDGVTAGENFRYDNNNEKSEN